MATILHIEDDAKNRLLVRKILAAAGHEVVDAQSGIEGIALANERTPELVLVDINIPDLDGYEVILRLRGIAKLKAVPIVAITAEGERQTTLAMGADGFLSKPIDAARFANIIEGFLQGQREVATESHESRLRERSQFIVERLENKIKRLLEANERLEDMVRLRREFLRNVSHELATPLTPVVGYLKLLLDEELGPLSPLQSKCLRSVDSATKRLRAVVDTLVDVSALETGRMNFFHKSYDFAALVQLALADVRPQFEERRLQLMVEGGDQSMPAWGDTDKLRRAMVHVLENAAKFTESGGCVAVGLRRGLVTDPADAWYEMSVADSGPGIEAKDRERVLEPFVQVDGSPTRKFGGVGLGLAFTQRVAEAHDGRVSIESPPPESVAEKNCTGALVRLRVAVRPATTHVNL